MYSKQYGKFFNYQHFTTIGILIVVTVLITCCHTCPSRRRSSPPTPPKKPETQAPPKATTVNPTFNPSGSAPSSPPSGSATSSPSESPSSYPSGTSQPGENDNYCFSTTIENITNEIIATKLEELGGTLSRLFDKGMEKQDVFLKGMKPNDTSCSNIQGYMIEITRIGENYTSDIKELNQSAAEKSCHHAQKCWPFSEPNTTEASSIQTEASKQPTKGTSTEQGEGTSTEQGEGNNAAGKSDNDGVSSTTIIVPVILVVMLVIVVIILVFWFKRRSTRKRYKDDQTQNSVDHVAGTVNGDVYTVVNPSAEKTKNGKGDNNDLVYTEMSHMKSGKSANEHPAESDQTEYADITHILRAGETTYGNVTPENDEKEAYANVVALQ